MSDDSLSLQRGVIEANTTLYRPSHSQQREAVTNSHAWQIYAQRNLGGLVMFERDGESYYVYDSDVYWFSD